MIDPESLCSAEGCGRPAHRGSLCNSHYQKLRRSNNGKNKCEAADCARLANSGDGHYCLEHKAPEHSSQVIKTVEKRMVKSMLRATHTAIEYQLDLHARGHEILKAHFLDVVEAEMLSAKNGTAQSRRDAIAAGFQLMEHLYGRPKQAVEVQATVDHGGATNKAIADFKTVMLRLVEERAANTIDGEATTVLDPAPDAEPRPGGVLSPSSSTNTGPSASTSNPALVKGLPWK